MNAEEVTGGRTAFELGHLVSRVEGGIATLVLNRPKRHNALTFGMWQTIPSAIEAFDADPDVKVVVIRGAGDKAFSAGGDIGEFLELADSPEHAAAEYPVIQAALESIERSPKAVIAMIRGYAMGGAFILVTACDLRIAAEDAVFSIPSARIGITISYPDTLRTIRLIGGREDEGGSLLGAPPARAGSPPVGARQPPAGGGRARALHLRPRADDCGQCAALGQGGEADGGDLPGGPIAHQRGQRGRTGGGVHPQRGLPGGSESLSGQARASVQGPLRTHGEEDRASEAASTADRTVAVGLVQLNGAGLRADILEKAARMAEEAKRRGARIVCFPELFSCPWFAREKAGDGLAHAEDLDGPTAQWMQRTARAQRTGARGLAPRAGGQRLFQHRARRRLRRHHPRNLSEDHIPDVPGSGRDTTTAPVNRGFRYSTSRSAGSGSRSAPIS